MDLLREAIGPKTGPNPLENELDPMGPIASRGGQHQYS